MINSIEISALLLTKWERHINELMPKEPTICNHFGCGKALTCQEQLFGDKCPDHTNTKKTDPTVIIKFA